MGVRELTSNLQIQSGGYFFGGLLKLEEYCYILSIHEGRNSNDYLIVESTIFSGVVLLKVNELTNNDSKGEN